MRNKREKEIEVAGHAGVIQSPTWSCGECGQAYWDKRDAENCAKQPARSIIEPGTIVVVGKGYGWHDGPDSWVILPADGHEFHGKKTLRFYYVYAGFYLHAPAENRVLPSYQEHGNYGSHGVRHVLVTKALLRRDRPHSGGWTRPATHYGFEIPDNQQELVERLGGDTSWAVGLKDEYAGTLL